MITIEMMVASSRRVSIASMPRPCLGHVAFSMLTGTLVTVAGFLPIGFAQAAARGNIAISLFAVIAVALFASWIVAVIFAPVIGVSILPKTIKQQAAATTRPGRFMRILRSPGLLHARQYIIIAVTLALFAPLFTGLASSSSNSSRLPTGRSWSST